jgi:hypothetical protein
MTRRVSRRGPLRQLLRQSDGTLHDVTEERPISRPELLEHLRAGGFFEARRYDNAAGCTAEVLCEVLLGRIFGAGNDLKRTAERP